MAEADMVRVSELANWLQVTERRVQQLAKDGVVIKAERGLYYLGESVRRYIRFLNDQIPNKQHSDAPTTSAVRADAEVHRGNLLQQKARIAEMEADEKAGVLVSADQEKRAGFALARGLRNNILNVPSRVSQDLAADGDADSVYRKLEGELISSLQDVAELARNGEQSVLPADAFDAECSHWYWVGE